MQKLKEMWQKLSLKSKKLLGIIAAATALVIAVAVFLIARRKERIGQGSGKVGRYLKSAASIKGISEIGIYLQYVYRKFRTDDDGIG